MLTSHERRLGRHDIEVSIVVPVRDAVDDLPALTRALTSQTVNGGRTEILFVDNGSTDGSAEWLRHNLPPHAKLLFSSGRPNAYAARNAGVEQARGRVLAFTDADCRPEPDWVERGLRALQDRLRVAGRVVVQASTARSLVEDLDMSRFLRQERFVQEAFGATANLFVHRRLFERIGLFDERLRSGADHEFGVRAAAAGVTIGYADDAVVRHRARRQFVALWRKAHRVGVGFGQELRLHSLGRLAVPARIVDRLSLIRRVWQREDVDTPRRLALTAGHAVLAAGTVAGCAKGYLDPLR